MKMRLLILISFLLFLNFLNLNAQTFILYGDKTYGGDQHEMDPEIIQMGGNQFIIAGSSETDLNGDKTDAKCDSGSAQPYGDVWVLRSDTAFNILWNKSMGGTKSETLPRLLKGSGNKILFSGISDSDSSCEKSDSSRGTSSDYWICMVDSNGNKVWDRTYGGTDGESCPQVIQLPSGDYILAGASESPVGGDKTVSNYGGAGDQDYWVLKLDSMGNKLWDKVYGGTGLEREVYPIGFHYCFQILNDSGNDFVLGGTTKSPVSGTISDTSRGLEDVWIVKLDSAGDKIWDKRFGGSGADLFSHIIHTDDNGYIIAGSSMSPQGYDVSDTSRGGFDYWLLKLDSLGNKQWDKRYGGNNTDYGNWIEKAPGGGYWVSGYTNSDSSGEVTGPSYGLNDYWIVKIDSAGNKLWDKRFGAYGEDKANSFVILPDSSIFLCGFAEEGTSAVKTDYGKGSYDYWLVHFKYTDNTTGMNENINQNNSVSVYPNPAHDIININSKPNFIATEMDLFDAAGRNIIHKNIHKTASVSIHELIPGIYFYEVKDTKGKNARGKLIKQ